MTAKSTFSKRYARFFSLVILLVTVLACQAQAPTPESAPPAPTPTVAAEATEAPETGTNTIRLTNGEWPPYLSETLPHNGLASRIVTEAFATQGIDVEYGFYPWPRALALAQDGSWDGSVVWFWSEERERDFYYSEPVIDAQYVFFHLKDYEFDWETMEDLEGVRIGATIDYAYGDEFTQAEEAGIIQVERVPADEQNFTKLLGGRIDVFPLDLEVGLNMLRLNFTPEEVAQITYHPRPIRSDPGYLLLSRKVEGNEALMETFNAGLAELEASGQLQQFIEESRAGE